MDYKDAGVDVTRGYKLVELIKDGAAATHDKNVLSGLGSFGAFYALPTGYSEPVLISGTDGVGTKLRYAVALDRHDTIGTDCVAMCVNDIICQGAKPLFFLDYYSCGKLVPEKAATVVNGIARACKEVQCSLVGGETAEMPDMYPDGEYDLAGFAVGIVDKSKIINGSRIVAGDTLIGLASSGAHSNGYSLIRKLIGEDRKTLDTYDETLGMTFGEAVIAPTRLYVNTILSLIEKFDIKGIANITGGGFIENIPRILPDSCGFNINVNSYPMPPLFKVLAKRSGLGIEKLYNTFNMGIGMVLVADPSIATDIIAASNELGDKAYKIGIVTGDGKLTLEKGGCV